VNKEAKMKVPEIVRRINSVGVSSPLLGFSIGWNPPPSERAVIKQLMVYLEDRRVLYNPYEAEDVERAKGSVLDMRGGLTTALGQLDDSSDAVPKLRAMRAAARKFLNQTESLPPRDLGHGQYTLFTVALGELRSTCGILIGQLCAMYGFDLDDELARILPEMDDGTGEEEFLIG
jgi:hypothetical protein